MPSWATRSMVTKPSFISVATIWVSSVVPLLAPLRTEVGERVIVDRDPAAEPLVGEMVLAEAFQFPCAADALESGEHPQRDEQPGIGGVAADMPLDGLDLLEPGVKIEAARRAQTARAWESGSSRSSSEAQLIST